MNDRPKLAAIGFALAALWVVVYWATPSPESATGEALTITFGDAPIDEVTPETRVDLQSDPLVVKPVVEPPAETIEQAMARVIPPKFETYVVAYGDNAHSISKKLYGTTSHWQSILKANSLTDPTKFRAGDTIRYPLDPKNVQGIPVDAAGNRIEDDPRTEPPAELEATYVVSKGDTLSGIAKAIYGKATEWRRIRDANRDKVNSEGTNIRPGMVLKIPPPAASGN